MSLLLPERLQEVSVFVFERDLEAVTEAILRSEAMHLEEVESETWSPQRRWAELAARAGGVARRADELADELGTGAVATGRAATRRAVRGGARGTGARGTGAMDTGAMDTGSRGMRAVGTGAMDTGATAGAAARPPRRRGMPAVPAGDALDEPVRPSAELPALEAELRVLEAKAASWRGRAKGNAVQEEAARVARAQLELLRPVEAPVESLRDLKHQHLVLGTMPAENMPRVAAALFSIAFVLAPLETRGGRSLVAAASTSEDAAILDRALRSAFFEPAPLPAEAHGRPTEALAAIEDGLAACEREGLRIEAERQRLSAEVAADLRRLRTRAHACATLLDAMRRFPNRGEVYLVGGWVPDRRLGDLRVAIRSAAEGPVVLESVPPGRRRHGIPTLLRTPAWLRPFDALVSTFGLAGYRELNPTVVVAATFLFMYGMMFGDLGHGVLLALLGGLLYLRGRSPFMIVVAAAGVSGALFGLVYGTVFGAPLLPPLWLRPLESIQSLLLASVVAGAVVLNLGFVLNLVTRLRERDLNGLLLGKTGLLGLCLYWSLVGGGALALTGRLAPGVVAGLVALFGGVLWLQEPVMARLSGRRPTEPLGEALVTGFFEFFEAVLGFASNSLSFVRLGAFAVAHEGLSSMVLRYAGGPGGWLVVLFGTALIVGFEGVVVGIQALRLEYFEFFGRFFRGDGTPFVPLSFQGGRDGRMAIRS